MIFASAGHRAPFNRLMRLLDGWAASKTVDLFGEVGMGGYQPKNFRSVARLEPVERHEALDRAALIITDTNIELLIAALERQIPIAVLPRQAIFGEDIGSVQAALARRIASIPGLSLATDEAGLIEYLDRFCNDGEARLRPNAPDRRALVASILGESVQ